MTTPSPDHLPIAEARANLSDVIASVRHSRRIVWLTRRGVPQAALVPAEVADELAEHGGPDAAVAKLRSLRA